jgi:hypothetical protein
MHGLVYVSTATTLPTHSIVDSILDSAHRRNPALGITGMLLWKEMAFAQYIEGPPDALDLLWTTLLRDERHEDVALLSRWELEERFFGDWSMASHRLNRRQHWEILERRETESPEDHAAWILALMNDAHRRAMLH